MNKVILACREGFFILSGIKPNMKEIKWSQAKHIETCTIEMHIHHPIKCTIKSNKIMRK
jgi:hypothetical protein